MVPVAPAQRFHPGPFPFEARWDSYISDGYVQGHPVIRFNITMDQAHDLLAAPQNHNYRLIAAMFGQGVTYNSIEGRFEKHKADAANLKKSKPRKKKAGAAGVAAGGAGAKSGEGGRRVGAVGRRTKPEPEATTEDTK
ncbi:MAG: hypothetical protein M1816_002614 [Peltula sp. TS41687]|nr:MAG: hypothetical protein M1816_002614 [Peltula sp. TS41687]